MSVLHRLIFIFAMADLSAGLLLLYCLNVSFLKAAYGYSLFISMFFGFYGKIRYNESNAIAH